RAEIKELHQRLRTTTVYVTHDQVEAMTMADKVVVMRGGNIEQVGSPLDLYDNPVNTFVAGFIGSPSMNLLSGRMTPKGFQVSADIVLPSPSRKGEAVWYGIRPEQLNFGPGGVPATIVVMEPM